MKPDYINDKVLTTDVHLIDGSAAIFVSAQPFACLYEPADIPYTPSERGVHNRAFLHPSRHVEEDK